MGWRLYIMHAFFCVISFILGKWLPGIKANNLVYFLYPETRGVPLEEMDKLFGDDIDDDDEDDDDEDDEFGASETSSLVSSLRTGRTGSALPTSRNASPMPARADNSLMGRLNETWNGLVGARPPRRPSRGRYNAIADE